LDRHLREIGSAQGPTIQIVGQELVNFSSNDYLCEAIARPSAEML